MLCKKVNKKNHKPFITKQTCIMTLVGITKKNYHMINFPTVS